MKRFFVVAALLCCSSSLFSQANYDRAIGIRFVGGATISYKSYFRNDNNLELQASLWKRGTRFAGLYEWNYPISGLSGLNFIIGPGVHVGFWNSGKKDKNNSGTECGIDGIVGLDYGFPKIPVNISVDWQPSLTLVGGSDFTPSLGGIGIRYTF